MTYNKCPDVMLGLFANLVYLNNFCIYLFLSHCQFPHTSYEVALLKKLCYRTVLFLFAGMKPLWVHCLYHYDLHCLAKGFKHLIIYTLFEHPIPGLTPFCT